MVPAADFSTESTIRERLVWWAIQSTTDQPDPVSQYACLPLGEYWGARRRANWPRCLHCGTAMLALTVGYGCPVCRPVGLHRESLARLGRLPGGC